MARQEDSCWRCGTSWATGRRPVLRLVPDDAGADGWANEGGRVPSEVTLPLPATAATR